MAMSMKDLMHSDDDDDSLESISSPALPTKESTLKLIFTKGTKRLSSHFEKESQKNTITDSIDGDEKLPATVSSSTGWIKDKVAGSLNRLSNSKNVYSSVDIVQHEHGPLTSDNIPKLSKAQSEMNLKSSTNRLVASNNFFSSTLHFAKKQLGATSLEFFPTRTRLE